MRAAGVDTTAADDAGFAEDRAVVRAVVRTVVRAAVRTGVRAVVFTVDFARCALAPVDFRAGRVAERWNIGASGSSDALTVEAAGDCGRFDPQMHCSAKNLFRNVQRGHAQVLGAAGRASPPVLPNNWVLALSAKSLLSSLSSVESSTTTTARVRRGRRVSLSRLATLSKLRAGDVVDGAKSLSDDSSISSESDIARIGSPLESITHSSAARTSLPATARKTLPFIAEALPLQLVNLSCFNGEHTLLRFQRALHADKMLPRPSVTTLPETGGPDLLCIPRSFLSCRLSCAASTLTMPLP